MPYGLVDDKLHSHVKWRRATKGARALWTTALSWCSDHPSDGFVPRDMLRSLDGTRKEAANLVAVGLWGEVDGGWSFHQWDERNPDAASIKAKRNKESKAGREGNHRRWHVARELVVPDCDFCRADRVPDRGPESGTRSAPQSGPGFGGESSPTRLAPESSPTPTPYKGDPIGGGSLSRGEDSPPPDDELSPTQMLAEVGVEGQDRMAFMRSLSASGIKSPTGAVIAMYREGTLKDRVEEWRESVELEASKPRVIQANVTKAKRVHGKANYDVEVCEAHGSEASTCPMCRAGSKEKSA